MSYQTICYNAYNLGNTKDIELKKFTLEKDERGYYLAATYRVETDHAIREIDVPKIRLDLDEKRFSIKVGHDPFSCIKNAYANLGFGDLPLDFSVDEYGITSLYTDRLLEEKCTEMTLDEIEKKLGYKVKIVNKKEN